LTCIAVPPAGGETARTNLERQEAECRAYCAAQRFIVDLVYYDVASGDTYLRREQLSLLRERYRQGHIHGIVVTDLYHLARRLTHLIILIQEMEDAHITLY
jgi:DNA invertase Pin-like site-specific DNA recombinase